MVDRIFVVPKSEIVGGFVIISSLYLPKMSLVSQEFSIMRKIDIAIEIANNCRFFIILLGPYLM